MALDLSKQALAAAEAALPHERPVRYMPVQLRPVLVRLRVRVYNGRGRKADL